MVAKRKYIDKMNTFLNKQCVFFTINSSHYSIYKNRRIKKNNILRDI